MLGLGKSLAQWHVFFVAKTGINSQATLSFDDLMASLAYPIGSHWMTPQKRTTTYGSVFTQCQHPRSDDHTAFGSFKAMADVSTEYGVNNVMKRLSRNGVAIDMVTEHYCRL